MLYYQSKNNETVNKNSLWVWLFRPCCFIVWKEPYSYPIRYDRYPYRHTEILGTVFNIYYTTNYLYRMTIFMPLLLHYIRPIKIPAHLESINNNKSTWCSSWNFILFIHSGKLQYMYIVFATCHFFLNCVDSILSNIRILNFKPLFFKYFLDFQYKCSINLIKYSQKSRKIYNHDLWIETSSTQFVTHRENCTVVIIIHFIQLCNYESWDTAMTFNCHGSTQTMD